MQTLSKPALIEALIAAGVGAGDGLLVHSALQFLGQPEGGVQMYLDALQELLGPGGNIAVPTFNFGFARGEDFDPANTLSVDMGAFSELVRRRPDAQRTTHPMQSLAVLGAHAADLASRDTPSAFDAGSAFDRMLELDFKLLLLGADVQAVSIIHYSEQRASVPYRYWKDFQGRLLRDGEWQPATYRMFVRDMQVNSELRLAPVQEALEARGQWHSAAINYGQIASCRLADFVAAADELLAADPWALVANRPESAAKD